MTDFILQILLFISFGIIVYMAARALPRISEEMEDNKKRSFLSSIPARKIDLALASFLVKTLRKTKIAVLRFDNTLNTYIGKVKSHTTNTNGNGKQKNLFTVSEENKAQDENKEASV